MCMSEEVIKVMKRCSEVRTQHVFGNRHDSTAVIFAPSNSLPVTSNPFICQAVSKLPTHTVTGL